MASVGTTIISQATEVDFLFVDVGNNFRGLWTSVAFHCGYFLERCRVSSGFFTGMDWLRSRAGTAGVLVLGVLGG